MIFNFNYNLLINPILKCVLTAQKYTLFKKLFEIEKNVKFYIS